MITAHCCRKSAGTETRCWGTKNDRIMNRPMTAVTRSGSSRFIAWLRFRSLDWLRSRSSDRHPVREAVPPKCLEDAADEDHEDHQHLEHVGALQATHEAGLA